MGKKAVLMAVTTIVLAAAMIGGATMAWFTDSDDAGQVTMTAGTLLVEAGTSMIYGVEVNTGHLYEIDVTTGEKYLLFDKTSGTHRDDTDVNYVNSLAFDRQNNRLYYTSFNKDLYYYDFKGNDKTNEILAGELPSNRTAGATFGRGYYWYIPQNTDDLYRLGFKPDGTIDSGNSGLYIENFTGRRNFNFGDIAMDIQGNILYGSANAGGTKVFFKIDLTDPDSYEEIKTSNPHHMQIAFGANGVLYGHATEGSGSAGQDRGWYAITNLETGDFTKLDWSPGERNFNDLASNYQNNWNPGDTDKVRYVFENKGTKNMVLRFTPSFDWEKELGIDNITVSLSDESEGSWEEVGNIFYYTGDPLAPGETVALCLNVHLDGLGTDNDYQGASLTIDGTVEAIQASNYAPYYKWGVNYYGTPNNN